MKTAKLILVSENNNNKFYNMTDDGQNIHVEFGRVDSKPRNATYSSYMWDKIYNDKIKKGYTDVTSYAIIDDNNTTYNMYDGISSDIIDVLKFLIESAKTKISNNYNISTENVTIGMINKAQDIINNIGDLYNTLFEYDDRNLSDDDIAKVNHLFLELYKVIPRKMKIVRDYLIHNGSSEEIKKLLINEQSLLDTLAGQVKDNDPKNETTPKFKNILDEINVSIELVKDKTESDKVYSYFESNKRYIKHIYKVTNKTTEEKFNPDNINTTFLFHGSRNENWFNIIKTGLLIRPSCAQITGAMFSSGIYFANKAQKSKGYTSAPGSYWAKGKSKKYFLAIYNVAVGKQKHIYKHTSDCYNITYSKLKNEGYDSVYAHGGIDLRNDEFIIYKTNQCTIKYLIELEE